MTDGFRIVHEHAPTVGASYCLKSVERAEHKVRLCCLHRGHDGKCLPWPRWSERRAPRVEVTDENPKYAPEPRRAS